MTGMHPPTTTAHPASARRGQRGRTVVELMISIAIGMAVVIGVVAVYTNASSAARSGVQLSDIESQSAIALRVMQSSIQMAGYGDLSGDAASALGPRSRSVLLAGPGIVGCENGRFNNPAAGDFNCVAAPAGAGDALVLRFQSDKATGPAQGALRDCLGGAQPVLANAFWRDGANLVCFGSAVGNAQPMIGDVEEFEVLYGVDEQAFAAREQLLGPPPQRITRLMNAAEVAVLDTTGYSNPWDYVIGVQVCIRIATTQAGTALASNVTFNRCPATAAEAMTGATPTATAADGRLRRTVVQTFMLRNRGVGNASQAGA